MTLKLNGSSSGSVSIDAPASTAGGADRTLTLPDDSSNGVIKTSTYPSSIQVLEQFFSPCDGSTIATSQGDITVQNVTAAIDVPESYTDLTGSVITYTPPTGTTQVIYEFQYMLVGHDSPAFTHIKLMLAGVEVTDARKLEEVPQSGNTYCTYKWQIRDYSSSNDSFAHQIRYWDGADVTDFVTKPSIGITAIGAA